MDARLLSTILVVVGLMVVIGLPLAWYNKPVCLRHLIRESWASVDALLRPPSGLMPNLVNVIKAYSQHDVVRDADHRLRRFSAVRLF